MYRSLILARLTSLRRSASKLSAVEPPQGAGLARLLRFPDIHGDMIAFVYAGDIWTVPGLGRHGAAAHLAPGARTLPEVFARRPLDCLLRRVQRHASGLRHLRGRRRAAPAHLSQRCRPASAARRLRQHACCGWTPDGKNVLFRANRVPQSNRLGRPLPRSRRRRAGAAACQSRKAARRAIRPTGRGWLITPISNEFRGWKRYRGGQSPDVWIYDLDAQHRRADHERRARRTWFPSGSATRFTICPTATGR